MAKSVWTADYHIHMWVFSNTVTTKLEAHLSTTSKNALTGFMDFSLLELKSPNVFEYDNAPVHKVRSIMGPQWFWQSWRKKTQVVCTEPWSQPH